MALILAVGAVVIAAFRAETSAQDVAERVSPVVAEQQVRTAREERRQEGRRLLAAANEELRRQGLPVVADPGPEASADQLVVAASTAQVMGLLPPPLRQQLRDGGQDVLVLPVPDGTLRSPSSRPGVSNQGVEPTAFRAPDGSGGGPSPAPPAGDLDLSPPDAVEPPPPASDPPPGRGGVRVDLPLLPPLELPLPRLLGSDTGICL
ncbi:hypothetical protein [Pseudonocardia sp. NPDC049635]|uniref:hypothetical protein n=1 Tax=Pseudonocardia sp. NPDC049635 TaxID=3155506 RepID=UPI0033EAD60C